MNIKSYIYALVDPRDKEVRYVGKTTDLRRRTWSHLHSVKDTKTNKKAWIRGLQNVNLNPLVMLLAVVPKSLDGIYEIIWIRLLKRKFKLTNITKGGDGGDTLSGTHRPKEWQDKIALSNTGKKRTEEQRSHIGDANRGRTQTTEEKQIRRKSMLGKNIKSVHRILVSPSGELFSSIQNLPVFAQEHNVSAHGLWRVVRGYRKSYKGWKRG